MRTVKTAIYNLFICLFAHPTKPTRSQSNTFSLSPYLSSICLYCGLCTVQFRKGNKTIATKVRQLRRRKRSDFFSFPVQVACSIPSIQFIATTSSAALVNHNRSMNGNVVNQRLTANFGISHTFTVDFDICYHTSK